MQLMPSLQYSQALLEEIGQAGKVAAVTGLTKGEITAYKFLCI